MLSESVINSLLKIKLSPQLQQFANGYVHIITALFVRISFCVGCDNDTVISRRGWLF